MYNNGVFLTYHVNLNSGGIGDRKRQGPGGGGASALVGAIGTAFGKYGRQPNCGKENMQMWEEEDVWS